MEMERGSIAEENAQARARGLSYGQWVGAVYYPVTILQVLPDGGRIIRTAAVPEPVMPVVLAEEPKEKAKKPVSVKPERKCIICGRVLGQYQRKYCSDECDRKAAKERYAAQKHKPYVSTAIREDKPCAVCGKMMLQVTRQQRYCSPECHAEGKRRLQRDYRQASAQEPKARFCRVCGTQIEGRGIKYCTRCAASENARRQRERNRARRRITEETNA